MHWLCICQNRTHWIYSWARFKDRPLNVSDKQFSMLKIYCIHFQCERKLFCTEIEFDRLNVKHSYVRPCKSNSHTQAVSLKNQLSKIISWPEQIDTSHTISIVGTNICLGSQLLTLSVPLSSSLARLLARSCDVNRTRKKSIKYVNWVELQ